MGRIIAFANQKGGVGKTTTAINLASRLASRGLSILLADLDPQGNVSTGLGIDKDRLTQTIYDCMVHDHFADEIIVPGPVEHLDILPSNTNLAGAQVELIDESFFKDDMKFTRLRRLLIPLKERYDFIIIDCPPSLGILTLNALVAADGVIIPLQCEFYALEGLRLIQHTVSMVKQNYNHLLEIDGVVMTMYDARTNLSTQVVEDVKTFFKTHSGHVFNSIIPRNVRLSEAPSFGVPIDRYDQHSSGAHAYEAFTQELLVHLNWKKENNVSV